MTIARSMEKRSLVSVACIRLATVLSKIGSGHNGPSLDEAIACARAGSLGRIGIDDEAVAIIITAKMIVASLMTGAEGVLREQVNEGRETNRRREAQLERLKAMRHEFALEVIERVEDQRKIGRVALVEHELEMIVETVEGLDQAIENLERLVESRSEQLKGSGGNFNVFERNFVRAVREIWIEITRDIDGSTVDPGYASRPVVEFAAALWTAYGFEEPAGRDLTDWLAERFANVKDA